MFHVNLQGVFPFRFFPRNTTWYQELLEMLLGEASLDVWEGF